MALRILQFSTLFTIGYSLGTRQDTSFHGPNEFPVINLSLNITDPDDVVVQRGQSARLKCEAVSSDVDMKYSWIRNGELLPGNDSRWLVQSDGTLYMPKVVSGRKSNGVLGEYHCLVRNNAGALLSNVARLRVASIESNFSTNPANQNVPEGITVILKCKIHSTPPVKIQWELNNLTLPHNNRYVPLPNGILIIQDSRISDSGSYRCKATNDLLKKTRYSNSAVVSITASMTNAEAPSIVPFDILLNNTILMGDNLTLYCVVIGWPIATVQWLNNHNIIISNGTILKIINASKTDTGNYTCTAHNSVGHTKRQFRVDVLQKPRIISSPVSKFSPPSSTVRLDCIAEGNPEPKITWLKNGDVLNYTARIKKQPKGLVFSHTFTSDSGIYQCIAVNSVGRAWAAARILISIHHHLQPSPPQNLQCRPYDSTSVCLNWTGSANVKAYNIYSVYKTEDGFEQGGPGGLSNMTFHLIKGLNNNINYTFYVLSFTDAASNASESVNCTPGKMHNRNVEIKMIKPDTALVKWNEISTDRECSGKRNAYKVQWRVEGRESAYVESTKQQSLLVTGLSPQIYEFHVSTLTDQEPNWISFAVPIINNFSGSNNKSELNQTNSSPTSPINFEGAAKTSTSVALNWLNADKTSKFFTVCYLSLKAHTERCDEETQLKSYKTELKIDGLEPNTTYKFKVRAYNFDDTPGPYSQPIEIHTPEDVPSPVMDLAYRTINESSICLHWQEPQKKNGKLKSYIISYTPDKNWPLENWLNISIPSYQQNSMNCWIDDKNWLETRRNTISMVLGNLTCETQYMLLVRAVSQVGIGDPNYPIIINTKILKPTDHASSLYKQKLGIILGTIIALICILVAIICILLRRRCLKRRALARARLAASNNYYPAVAHYATHADSVQVRLEDTCVQESQHLVQEPLTTNIPPIVSNHIDTKGGEEFPNGYVNGSAKPFMNGGLSKKPMHIRENPQYYAHQCNGHTASRKPFRFEEDTNSNVKPSKFYNFHRLFDSSKKAGSSKYNHCSAMENNDKYIQSSDDETPNEYDSLNVTRLTCLDDSLGLNVNNNKRISPVLDPNG